MYYSVCVRILLKPKIDYYFDLYLKDSEDLLDGIRRKVKESFPLLDYEIISVVEKIITYAYNYHLGD